MNDGGESGAGALWMIDNYDSFTHNVVDLLRQLGAHVVVVRNDAVSVAEVAAARPRGIVLSPGPGRPRDAGISLALVKKLGPTTPILGICLGHQVIANAFGGRIVRAKRPLHGSASAMTHRGAGLLKGLPSPFEAARYHSLVVDPDRPGRGLAVTCRSAEGEIMGLAHRRLPVEGVQFHPESYLTPKGPEILAAFLRRTGVRPRRVRMVVR